MKKDFVVLCRALRNVLYGTASSLLLGYSWRAPYVLASLPGILVSLLILITFK